MSIVHSSAGTVRITNPLCGHPNRQPSRLWVHITLTREEPLYYPPQGLVPVDVCLDCGVVIVPPDMLSECVFEWKP